MIRFAYRWQLRYDSPMHQWIVTPLSIMKVILEKIIHFLCYGTPNMTSRWLIWSPIIKELYLIHYSPLKKKDVHKKSNSRTATGDIWMLILLFGWRSTILDLPKMGFLKCCKIWTPWFFHRFVPIDISTLTEFGDSNLANPVSVTYQPPPVTAHIQCHVNGQNQGTGLFVINQMANRPTY